MTTLTFPRRRARALGSQAAAALVVGLGHVIGWAGRRLPLLPGLAGAAMVSYGVALWRLPAGIVVGGVFLLAMDRQITLRGRGSGGG